MANNFKTLLKPYVYVIGSLRNAKIPGVAEELRLRLGWDVFDDWFAAGPTADDHWRDYEQSRGHTFQQALQGFSGQHVFMFDRAHLARASHVVLVLPAGKSGHLELGWALGRGAKGYILLDDQPERFDVMYAFADGVHGTLDAIVDAIQKES